MENLVFETEQDLNFYLYDFPKIGSGTEGECYLFR